MKECGNKKKISLCKKPITMQAQNFLQGTISTRAAVNGFFAKKSATNVQNAGSTAAKDQQSACDEQSEDCAQKTFITTFAA